MNDERDTIESADAYGRREGCFNDFMHQIFSPQACMQQLEPLSDPVDADGFIAQAGLQAARLPKPRVQLDTMESTNPDSRYLNDLHIGSERATHEISPFFSNVSVVRDLRLPLELVELDSNPELDLKEYLEGVHLRSHLQSIQEWLPLSLVQDENDEGLSFPPMCGRLRSLLLRELDTERISVSQEAQTLTQDLESSVSASCHQAVISGPIFLKFTFIEAELITPPLSPVWSDDTVKFIPDSETCVIEVTSEPVSLEATSPERLQRVLASDNIEADNTILRQFDATSASPAGIHDSVQKLSGLNIDVPIVLSSSSSDTSENGTTLCKSQIVSLGNAEAEPNEDDHIDIFDEALTSTLEAHRYYTELMVEQEEYDPIDSVSRVQVPVMNFKLPTPLWAEHLTSAKQQFGYIRNSLPYFHIHLEHGPTSNDKDLKWAPFGPGSGRVSTTESLEPLSDEGHHLLQQGPIPSLSSSSYFLHNRPLLVQRFKDEEYIEEDDQILSNEDHASSVQSLSSPSHSRKDLTSNTDGDSLTSLLRAASVKRKSENINQVHRSLLPLANDVDATSKLLEGFMEMRAAKKPRIVGKTETPNDNPQLSGTGTAPQKQQQKRSAQASLNEEEVQTPAAYPKIIAPENKGIFIVSLGIGQTLLRLIEAEWPADRLFDRDHSLHNQVVWSPSSAERKQLASPLSFEADITLTPAVGIIVTTLLKVKQKPLPNSKALSQIRDRVLRVSRKYETLLVLVSESNRDGETAGRISASDTAAYADFVAFAAALQSGVTPFFISRGDVALSKWILTLMCQYSPHVVSSERFMTAGETTWELFFRRAGMNVAAAQVLAGTLFEEAGKEGLARFVCMTVQQRTASYHQLLGGTKLLLNVSKVIDATWG